MINCKMAAWKRGFCGQKRIIRRLRRHLREYTGKDSIVLLKGSRGMALEHILEDLMGKGAGK